MPKHHCCQADKLYICFCSVPITKWVKNEFKPLILSRGSCYFVHTTLENLIILACCSASNWDLVSCNCSFSSSISSCNLSVFAFLFCSVWMKHRFLKIFAVISGNFILQMCFYSISTTSLWSVTLTDHFPYYYHDSPKTLLNTYVLWTANTTLKVWKILVLQVK